MALTKKIRFEVFKRDSFKCQYCGRSAPDVVLQADHIAPKSKGGKDDIMNLITSCFDCNMGKSDRELSDTSAVTKSKKQADELQARREQIEMMMEWHKSLANLEEETQNTLLEYFKELTTYGLNEHGLKILRGFVRRYEFSEILESMRISADEYLETNSEGEYTSESVEKAWKMIPRICNTRRAMKSKPYLKDLMYIRGILRNRFNMTQTRMYQSLDLMEAAHLAGMEIERIASLAKSSPSYYDFEETLSEYPKP